MFLLQLINIIERKYTLKRKKKGPHITRKKLVLVIKDVKVRVRGFVRKKSVVKEQQQSKHRPHV